MALGYFCFHFKIRRLLQENKRQANALSSVSALETVDPPKGNDEVTVLKRHSAIPAVFKVRLVEFTLN